MAVSQLTSRIPPNSEAGRFLKELTSNINIPLVECPTWVLQEALYKADAYTCGFYGFSEADFMEDFNKYARSTDVDLIAKQASWSKNSKSICFGNTAGTISKIFGLSSGSIEVFYEKFGAITLFTFYSDLGL
jgi:hypothetical protein